MSLKHYNYVISGKIQDECRFPEKGLWHFYQIISKIIPFVQGKPHITTHQYFIPNKNIKFGNIKWSIPEFKRIIDYHKSLQEFNSHKFVFANVTGSCPSIKVAASNGTTPQLYFYIQPIEGQDRANVGITLSIREDVYQTLLESTNEEQLLLSDTKFFIDVFKKKNRHFYGGSRIGSIMDIIPCFLYEPDYTLIDNWE